MAFDFRILDSKKLYPADKIQIDKSSYDPMTMYSKAKEIIFENSMGKVVLTGYFQLSQIKIEDLVKIQKNSIRFDRKFQEITSSTQLYQSQKMVVTLKDLPDKEDFLNMRELKTYINQIPAEIIRKEGKVSIVSSVIKNIDLRQFVDLYKSFPKELDENSDLNLCLDDKSETYEYEQDNSKFIIKNLKQTRKHKNEFGEYKSFDNERDSIQADHDNLKENLIKEQFENKIEEDLNFVNFDKDEKDFDFDLKKIQENAAFKFVDPLHLPKDKLKNFTKSYFNNSFKVCFNSRGELITPGKFNIENFRSKLNVNRIIPNKSLLQINSKKELNFEALEYYHKSTIINYLNILNKNLKEKITLLENNDDMDISVSPIGKSVLKTNNKLDYQVSDLSLNDHTDILDEYIMDLQNFKIQVKNTHKKDSQAAKLIEKLEKEIETLKLFKVLFLNCFKNRDANNNSFIPQFKSQGEEVKRMRKKKLTDWLIESISCEKKDENKLRPREAPSQIDQTFGEILNQLLQGKIKRAVEICIKNGLLNLSMIISNSNPSIRSRLIKDSIKSWGNIGLYESFPNNLRKIYNLLSGEEILRGDQGSEILTGCNWKQLFLSLSLHSMDQVKDISQILSEFEAVVNAHKSNKNLLPNINEKSNVNDINFTLIKLYRAIENNQTAKISELINTLMNTSNVFDEFSDCHLHYILVSVLLTTQENSDERFVINSSVVKINRSFDFNFLKKIHLKLLNKVTEELLLSENETAKTNWKYVINMIKLSNIPASIKNILTNELIFKNINIAKEDQSFLNNMMDGANIQEALGLYNYNRFNFKAAYQNFKNSKNFTKANEIFLFSILCLKIIENNVSNNTYEELNLLSNFSLNCSIWEKYGTVLHQYLVLLRKLEGDEIRKLELIDLSYIRNLIKKVDAIFIPKNQDRSYINMINLCRNKILGRLRKIYNTKTELISKKDENVKFLNFNLYYRCISV